MKPERDAHPKNMSERHGQRAGVLRILREAGVVAGPAQVEALIDERIAMIEAHAWLHAQRSRGLLTTRAYLAARKDADRVHLGAVAAILGAERFRRAKPGFRAYRRQVVADCARPLPLVRPRKGPAAKEPPRWRQAADARAALRQAQRSRATARAKGIAELVQETGSQAEVARGLGISRQRVGELLVRHRAWTGQATPHREA